MSQETAIQHDSDSDLSNEEKKILLLTSPCHFLTHMFILVFPAATMPIMNTLGMPIEHVVKLGFLMYLFYGLGSLPVGYIVDRWQARKMLLYGVYAMGAGLLLAGAFPSPRTMPLCLMLVGLGGSVYHPAGLALISRTVKRRGTALGINGVFGNMGIAFAPFITGVLTWLFSWREAFVFLGATSILIGFLLSLIRIDETPHPVTHTRSADGGEYIKYFLMLCGALVFGGLLYRGNMVLLPAYFELKAPFFHNLVSHLSFIKLQGSETLAATILTSLVFLMGIFGQLVGGRLADRYDLRGAYLFFHAASVPFVLAMAFTSNYVLAICAGMFMLFSLGMQPIENSLIAALTPTRWRSTSYAIKFVLNFGIGATVVYLIAFVKPRSSLEGVYLLLTGFAFLLVLSIIALIIASRNVREIRN